MNPNRPIKPPDPLLLAIEAGGQPDEDPGRRLIEAFDAFRKAAREVPAWVERWDTGTQFEASAMLRVMVRDYWQLQRLTPPADDKGA